MLYSEFQSPTMPETCQKVCVRVWWWVWWCKPIKVLSLDQAEQQVSIKIDEVQKVQKVHKGPRTLDRVPEVLIRTKAI